MQLIITNYCSATVEQIMKLENLHVMHLPDNMKREMQAGETMRYSSIND